MNRTLEDYISSFRKLKQGGTAEGKAPNKPILLITIIELIENGCITGNRIYISPELVGLFKENWLLLSNLSYSAELTQPLFHLQNDKAQNQQFWFVQPLLGNRFDGKTKNLTKLRSTIDFGYFSDDLFLLLTDPISRSLIKNELLRFYFSETRYRYNLGKANNDGYLNFQEEIVLNKPKARLKTIFTVASEEDVYVRSGLFKTQVHKQYNSTCSFTGMRLTSSYLHSFIDACHIKPFSVCFEDSINNGIALCPNLHRAFDRGLVSINDEYKILISSHISENENHVYSLKKLEGRKIGLPDKEEYYPSQENMAYHREHVFKD